MCCGYREYANFLRNQVMQNTYYMSYCDIGGRSICLQRVRKTAPLPPPASPEVEPHLDRHLKTDSKAAGAKIRSYV